MEKELPCWNMAVWSSQGCIWQAWTSRQHSMRRDGRTWRKTWKVIMHTDDWLASPVRCEILKEKRCSNAWRAASLWIGASVKTYWTWPLNCWRKVVKKSYGCFHGRWRRKNTSDVQLRIACTNGSSLEFLDLMSISLRGSDVQGFETKWDAVLWSVREGRLRQTGNYAQNSEMQNNWRQYLLCRIMIQSRKMNEHVTRLKSMVKRIRITWRKIKIPMPETTEQRATFSSDGKQRFEVSKRLQTVVDERRVMKQSRDCWHPSERVKHKTNEVCKCRRMGCVSQDVELSNLRRSILKKSRKKSQSAS